MDFAEDSFDLKLRITNLLNKWKAVLGVVQNSQIEEVTEKSYDSIETFNNDINEKLLETKLDFDLSIENMEIKTKKDDIEEVVEENNKTNKEKEIINPYLNLQKVTEKEIITESQVESVDIVIEQIVADTESILLDASNETQLLEKESGLDMKIVPNEENTSEKNTTYDSKETKDMEDIFSQFINCDSEMQM